MTPCFTMTGRIVDSVRLTYRTPAKTVQGLLPGGLELVTRGPWAFWSVLACRVEKARPAGLPRAAGLSYHHLAYRLVVQAMTDNAELIRGLYHAHGEVDARAVAALGNRLGDCRMHPASIEMDATDCGLRIKACDTGQPAVGSAGSDLIAAHAPARLAPGSCFPTLDEARRFGQANPDGLAVVDAHGQRALRITRVERAARSCSETPVVLHRARLRYFEAIDQTRRADLEWASRMGPMEVRWHALPTRCLLVQPNSATPRPAQQPATPATAPAPA